MFPRLPGHLIANYFIFYERPAQIEISDGYAVSKGFSVKSINIYCLLLPLFIFLEGADFRYLWSDSSKLPIMKTSAVRERSRKITDTNKGIAYSGTWTPSIANAGLTPGNLGQFVPRRVMEDREPTVVFNSSAVVNSYWNQYVAAVPFFNPFMEHVIVFALGIKCNLLGWSIVAMGPARGQIVGISDVLRAVIVAGGTGFILAHNHTSHSAEPSGSDKTLTNAMVRAAATVGLRMFDHVILADGSYYSFADQGLIEASETREKKASDSTALPRPRCQRFFIADTGGCELHHPVAAWTKWEVIDSHGNDRVCMTRSKKRAEMICAALESMHSGNTAQLCPI